MSAELIRDLRAWWEEPIYRSRAGHLSMARQGRDDVLMLLDALERAEKERDENGVRARDLEGAAKFAPRAIIAEAECDRLRAENESMRPYALRAGWPGETEWLSDC